MLNIDKRQGNVGIGTTAPATLLHVSQNPAPPGKSIVLISENGVAASVTTAATFRVANAGSAATYALAEFSSAASNTVITNAGSVGIGTTTPGQTLHVVGSANISQIANEPGGGQAWSWISGKVLSRPELDANPKWAIFPRTIAPTPIPTPTPTPSQIQGDINSDNKVDILDIVLIVKDFGKTSGYDPKVDLVQDEIINIFDVMVVVRNWGRTG